MLLHLLFISYFLYLIILFLVLLLNIPLLQAVGLLRASLITTSALTNGLSNFLSKMKPQEAAQSTSKIPKI